MLEESAARTDLLEESVEEEWLRLHASGDAGGRKGRNREESTYSRVCVCVWLVPVILAFSSLSPSSSSFPCNK